MASGRAKVLMRVAVTERIQTATAQLADAYGLDDTLARDMFERRRSFNDPELERLKELEAIAAVLESIAERATGERVPVFDDALLTVDVAVEAGEAGDEDGRIVHPSRPVALADLTTDEERAAIERELRGTVAEIQAFVDLTDDVARLAEVERQEMAGSNRAGVLRAVGRARRRIEAALND